MSSYYSDKEQNAKLRKPFDELSARMNDFIENLGEIGDDAYNNDDCITLGFHDKKASIYVCPETFEILETACKQIIEFIDEEYPASDPIGKIVKHYEIDNTGGNIWIAFGQLNSGEWFAGETPDIGESFCLFKTKSDCYECMPDDMVGEICCDNPKWTAMWVEIMNAEKAKETTYFDLDEWWNGICESVNK